jgi:hypothetical protein
MVNEIGKENASDRQIVSNTCCSLLRLQIVPERIHFLKFILEGYDGMALLSTVDAVQGLVEIRYPPEVENDLKKLLHSLGPQITNSTP